MAYRQGVQPNPQCPQCESTYTTKKGKRRNRLRVLQLYRCNECLHRFTGEPDKSRTYPLKLILSSITTYNLGHSLTETQSFIRKRYHIDAPERTIRLWLAEHRPLTTYARLRAAGKKHSAPTTILRSYTLQHKQVYEFQIHQAKLDLLLQTPAHRHLRPLKTYLNKVDDSFPHDLFRESHDRSSTFPADFSPPLTRKVNHATETAALVLPTSPTNRKRHETLQRFMLVNDSVTIAVETPIYLDREDLAYYRKRQFNLGSAFDNSFVTGHIDFLQLRNGFIHILDYKPDARKEKHAHVQLTIYALALSRRAKLPVKFFKCAWFDEHDYFEFFPLRGL